MKLNDQTPIAAYGATIFLSAFLLFQVQPMMGKMVLPWFGGAASVWTACMLFFQSLLLLGYLYTHWVLRHLSAQKQSLLHIVLLLACMFFLPISPSEAWKPQGFENPTLLILLLLTMSDRNMFWFSRHSGCQLLACGLPLARRYEQYVLNYSDGYERSQRSPRCI